MSTWVCSCLIAMNDENVYDEFIYFTLQINSSSRFTVDNKYVRLAAKDWEFWILASVIALVLLSRHSFMVLFLIKFQFWGIFILYSALRIGSFWSLPYDFVLEENFGNITRPYTMRKWNSLMWFYGRRQATRIYHGRKGERERNFLLPRAGWIDSQNEILKLLFFIRIFYSFNNE